MSVAMTNQRPRTCRQRSDISKRTHRSETPERAWGKRNPLQDPHLCHPGPCFKRAQIQVSATERTQFPAAGGPRNQEASPTGGALPTRRMLEQIRFSCIAQPPSFPPLPRLQVPARAPGADERGVLRHQIVLCSMIRDRTGSSTILFSTLQVHTLRTRSGSISTGKLVRPAAGQDAIPLFHQGV